MLLLFLKEKKLLIFSLILLKILIFYPPNTFVEAKIQRRISKRGGYFVKLPNGYQGFLKSKNIIKKEQLVVLLSKVFFDEEKPQTLRIN